MRASHQRAAIGGLGLAMVLGAGCDELVYSCTSNANCVVQGVQGYCISAGTASYCAFPYQPTSTQMACPSHLRWDTSAPMQIQGTCVILPDAVDAGTDLHGG